jgi:phenylpropionate dioxygenase-like ring-hydroxylating dioxygenase large terminal subunit
VAERHGLIWLGGDVDAYLGELAVDVAALRLDDHVLWRRSSVTRRCNWKLVVEAFLDGYHIRVLHRDSVYRYFVDGLVISERVGPHIRAMTARRKLREAPSELLGADVRQLATPSLLLFPATTVVEHPDFISIMTVTPLAPDLSQWDHMMLVPRERAGETELWDKAWTVIEEGVFQREDLWVCEQVQRGIATGAIDELLFGQLERAAAWFHEAVGAALDQPLHPNA